MHREEIHPVLSYIPGGGGGLPDEAKLLSRAIMGNAVISFTASYTS
jgi:hypothetical protein